MIQAIWSAPAELMTSNPSQNDSCSSSGRLAIIQEGERNDQSKHATPEIQAPYWTPTEGNWEEAAPDLIERMEKNRCRFGCMKHGVGKPRDQLGSQVFVLMYQMTASHTKIRRACRERTIWQTMLPTDTSKATTLCSSQASHWSTWGTQMNSHQWMPFCRTRMSFQQTTYTEKSEISAGKQVSPLP